MTLPNIRLMLIVDLFTILTMNVLKNIRKKIILTTVTDTGLFGELLFVQDVTNTFVQILTTNTVRKIVKLTN